MLCLPVTLLSVRAKQSRTAKQTYSLSIHMVRIQAHSTTARAVLASPFGPHLKTRLSTLLYYRQCWSRSSRLMSINWPAPALSIGTQPNLAIAASMTRLRSLTELLEPQLRERAGRSLGRPSSKAREEKRVETKREKEKLPQLLAEEQRRSSLIKQLIQKTNR